MAKPERRGGLGRGLGSLLPGSYESPAPVSPAPERQRVTIEVDEEAARGPCFHTARTDDG